MPGLLAPGSRLRTIVANLLVAVPAILFLWLGVSTFLYPTPPGPVEHMANQQLETSGWQRIRVLCAREALCRKFGEARQGCATAGNYKNCLDIKMGDDAVGLYPCTNNGTVWGASQDMPDQFTCLAARIF